MSDRETILAAIIGAVLAVVVVGYAVFYVPMSANYKQCGKVTLCETAPTESQQS